MWVPFLSRGSELALLLDAGNFRMACSKGEGSQRNMKWTLDVNDIQVNFACWQLSEVTWSDSTDSHPLQKSRSHRLGWTAPYIRVREQHCNQSRSESNQLFCKNHCCKKCIQPGLVSGPATDDPPKNDSEDHTMCFAPSCLKFCSKYELYC
jgi:hypothetical protein